MKREELINCSVSTVCIAAVSIRVDGDWIEIPCTTIREAKLLRIALRQMIRNVVQKSHGESK